MKNNDLSQKILGVIKKDKINPKPKWQFLFKRCVIWLTGILALILGALSFSVIIYLIKFSNWEVYSQLGNSALEFIVLTLPYFWLAFLVLFVFIIYYNIKHTKKGYRYPLPLVVVISLFGSLILGGIFFQVGWGQAIDDVLGERAPLYETVINRQIGFWAQTEEGRLAGVVISQIDENNIVIRDMEGKEWLVDIEVAEYRVDGKIEISEPVRLLGEMTSSGSFEASLILPMRPGRGFMKRPDAHRSFIDGEKPLGFIGEHEARRIQQYR